MKLSALLNSNINAGEYIIFGCFDSQQAKINGENNLIFKKNKNGKLDFTVSIPQKNGKYEFQIFFVPAPYDKIQDDNFTKYTIITSQKYIIYVN